MAYRRLSCDVIWNQMLVRSSYQVAPKPQKNVNKCLRLAEVRPSVRKAKERRHRIDSQQPTRRAGPFFA